MRLKALHPRRGHGIPLEKPVFSEQLTSVALLRIPSGFLLERDREGLR